VGSDWNRPVGTYESAVVLRAARLVSDWANSKQTHVDVNLRFVAQYGCIVYIVIALWLFMFFLW